MEILVGLIFHCFDGVRRKMSTLGYVAYKADHKGTRSRRSSSSAIEGGKLQHKNQRRQLLVALLLALRCKKKININCRLII